MLLRIDKRNAPPNSSCQERRCWCCAQHSAAVPLAALAGICFDTCGKNRLVRRVLAIGL